MTCHDSTDLSVSRCFHRARSEFLCAATITESPALMRGTIFSCWKATGTGEIQKSLWPFIKGSGQLIIESQQEVFIFVTMGGANQQTPPTSTVQAVFGNVFASCPPSNRFVFLCKRKCQPEILAFASWKKIGPSSVVPPASLCTPVTLPRGVTALEPLPRTSGRVLDVLDPRRNWGAIPSCCCMTTVKYRFKFSITLDTYIIDCGSVYIQLCILYIYICIYIYSVYIYAIYIINNYHYTSMTIAAWLCKLLREAECSTQAGRIS